MFAGVGALSLAACSSDSTSPPDVDPPDVTPPMLVTSVTMPPDQACPASGVTIQQGLDLNGNGLLEPSEITSTETFCGGVSTQLTTARALTLGDVDCPLGGVTTQSGVDDGAGGGVANDSILQAGEVRTAHTTCAALLGYTVPTFGPPPAVPNQPAFTISTHGGAGAITGGGNGGQIAMYKDGTRGGHLKVFATGLADTSDALPTYTPAFGATKLDVATSMTLARYDVPLTPDPVGPIDGEYYYLGNQLLYRLDVDHAQVPVTGLHVAAGATLTLPDTGLDQLEHDIVIEGTVTSVATTPGNPAAITLATHGAFIGAAGALITTAGAPVANAPGGNGGSIAIFASMVVNQATLDSSGATGGSIELLAGGPGFFAGGRAGSIRLSNNEGVGRGLYNTGAITARGGAGGPGGSGGEVDLLAAAGGIHNRGALTATGGDGLGNGAAGAGGSLVFNTQIAGTSVNSGALTTRGGNADPACIVDVGVQFAGPQPAGCNGGNGGAVQWDIAGGTFHQAGSVATRGGVSVSARGGRGGDCRFSSREGYDPGGTGFVLTGDLVISGDLHLEGGDGASGGDGGSLEIDQRINQQPAGQQVQLLGYTDLVTSGGDGVASGGGAGQIVLFNSPSYARCCDFEGTGAVVNHANLTARGGNATTGTGGSGAQIMLEPGNGQSYSGVSGGELVLNTGAIDISGGAGASGGATGSLLFAGVDGLQNSGSITAHGGNASGDAAVAGATQDIDLRSGGVLLNSGTISVAGGAASGLAGIGGTCSAARLSGVLALNNSAVVSCDGGAAASGIGGTGGTVELFSLFTPVASTATCTAAGGTGLTAGEAGRVMIDGVLR